MSTYTPEQMEKRQKSVWTIVQVIGAPIQFLVFLISLGFVIYTMTTGDLFDFTNATIIFKIAFLYFMCITGMFWEHDVFGHYYFAPQFFWEDLFTTVVRVTHTAYLVALFLGVRDHQTLLVVIFIAYVSYLINAWQYLYKYLKNRGVRKEQAAKKAAAASQ